MAAGVAILSPKINYLIGVNFMANRKQLGFTLAEMLVAVTIFALTFMIVSAIFMNGNKLQQHTASFQRLQNDGRYILEKLAREIRAREINYPSLTSNPWTELRFQPDENQETLTVSFDASNGNLLYILNGGSAPINSEDVEVVSANFYVYPTTEDQWASASLVNDQGRVTILLKLRNRNINPEYQRELVLQTTISNKVYKR